MIQVLSSPPNHEPPHECNVHRRIGFLSYPVGTIVLCECGQHHILTQGWLTHHLEWKPISAWRAARLMAKRGGMSDED